MKRLCFEGAWAWHRYFTEIDGGAKKQVGERLD